MSSYTRSVILVDLPPEVLLSICSYLDVPDLTCLTRAIPSLNDITSDPILHRQRLYIVFPSRVNHSLFGTSPEGHGLRPSIADLVHRGVMRGLNIERRWRTGAYFYSRDSIVQYERGCALARQHASHVISIQLNKRLPSPAHAFKSLYTTLILPDTETASTQISRTLLPILRQLKWCIRRDQLARRFKASPYATVNGRITFLAWLEGKGRHVVQEGEKIRLVVCPDIKRKVCFYEALDATARRF